MIRSSSCLLDLRRPKIDECRSIIFKIWNKIRGSGFSVHGSRLKKIDRNLGALEIGASHSIPDFSNPNLKFITLLAGCAESWRRSTTAVSLRCFPEPSAGRAGRWRAGGQVLPPQIRGDPPQETPGLESSRRSGGRDRYGFRIRLKQATDPFAGAILTGRCLPACIIR